MLLPLCLLEVIVAAILQVDWLYAAATPKFVGERNGESCPFISTLSSPGTPIFSPSMVQLRVV